MKSIYKKLVFILLFIFFYLNTNAQSSLGMTYQAVVRNASNTLVANAAVGVRVSIIQNTATGTVAYAETHTPITNVNGLATFNIGTGTSPSGSYFLIDWANGPYFLKTDIDPAGGTNYSITNTAQFMSVPYAQFAYKSADSGWGLGGDAVLDGSFIGTTNNADLVFKRNNAYAGKLGFDNTYLGKGAGEFNTMGGNVAIGTNALNRGGGGGSTGNLNTAVGYDAYPNNVQGYGNSAFGNNALFNNTQGFHNAAIGGFALKDLTTGDRNTSIGYNSLNALTTGDFNIGIGSNSQVPSTTASYQLSIGNVIYGANMGNIATATIGIGVPVPTERLEVAGKTKTTNLQVTAGAGDNRILTSDATGNAAWETPSNFNAGFETRMTVTQSIPNDVPTKLVFSTESTDDANAHNATNGNWTIPSAGFYHIYATLGFNNFIAAGTYIRMIVYKNGVAFRTNTSIVGTSSILENFDIAVDTKLNQNDVISIFVNQASGAAVQVGASAGSVYFSGFKVY